ncbi:MAG: hypothetical protein WCQ95_09930 [Bacteroidota bacterium]
MKPKFYLLFTVLFAVAIVFSSCKKQSTEITQPEKPYVPLAKENTLYGMGTMHGFPTGTHFSLPSYVHIIGDIRGGILGKSYNVDKAKYQGLFPYVLPEKSWIDYGTGTFVNLYIKFYNSLATGVTLTLPGGLIFCDSTDLNDSIGIYQKGYILQSVNIPIAAQDTAFACLRAYCLNAHLMPSNYNAVYYIGPITNNPDLNQISSIMAPKQYPFGQEGSIQSIIWNVTDYGQTLTTADVAFLNALP